MILALAVVLVAAAAPWAFGCTDPQWAAALAVACLVAAALSSLDAAARPGRPDALPRPLVLGACLLVLPALLGLLPVPAALHRLLVPGGASLLDAAGAEDGWRTLSLRARSTLEAATLAAAYAGAFLVVARAARGPGSRTAAASLLCAAGAALAVFGVVQDLRQTDPPTIYGTFEIYEVATPFGPYVNRNHFAGAMEILAGVAAGEALGAWAAGRRVAAALAGACALAMLGALLVTTSRGGLLGAAAGAAFLATSVPRARRLRLVVAAGAGAVVLFLVVRATGILDGLLESLLRIKPRWSQRFAVQGDAFVAFLRNPFVGTGAGTFEAVFAPFQRLHDLRFFGNAHSDWAQFLMETGLAGAAVAGVVVRRLVRCLRDGAGPSGLTGPQRWRVLGPSAGVIAIAVHGLVDINLHVPANALLTAVALSLACGAALGPGGAAGAAETTGASPSPPTSSTESLTKAAG